jgi:hypothetical protein
MEVVMKRLFLLAASMMLLTVMVMQGCSSTPAAGTDASYSKNFYIKGQGYQTAK